MKNIIPLIAVTALLAVLGSCKTTEANYRAAYERAVSGRDSLATIESTVYGAHRRSMGSRVFVMGADTFEVRSQRVRVTDGGGGITENLRPFNVVVGQFKQLFNARSMRERLADNGYPSAFVVETAEPYYYVVLSSHNEQAAAAAALRDIPASFPVAIKPPLPFILQTSR